MEFFLKRIRARTDYDNSTWDNCPKQKVVVCSNVGTIVPRVPTSLFSTLGQSIVPTVQGLKSCDSWESRDFLVVCS